MLVFAIILVCPINFTIINADCAMTAHKGQTYTSLAECQRDFVGYVVRPYSRGAKPPTGPPIIMKAGGQPQREANLLFMATCREAG
jgi:hypothetical protein